MSKYIKYKFEQTFIVTVPFFSTSEDGDTNADIKYIEEAAEKIKALGFEVRDSDCIAYGEEEFYDEEHV